MQKIFQNVSNLSVVTFYPVRGLTKQALIFVELPSTFRNIEEYSGKY